MVFQSFNLLPRMCDPIFAEAGAMGQFGGFFGVVLGWLIGQALTWGTTIYLHGQNLPGVKISYVPWWLALGAIGFPIMVSLIAGLYPTARAARLDSVEARLYEGVPATLTDKAGGVLRQRVAAARTNHEVQFSKRNVAVARATVVAYKLEA